MVEFPIHVFYSCLLLTDCGVSAKYVPHLLWMCEETIKFKLFYQRCLMVSFLEWIKVSFFHIEICRRSIVVNNLDIRVIWYSWLDSLWRTIIGYHSLMLFIYSVHTSRVNSVWYYSLFMSFVPLLLNDNIWSLLSNLCCHLVSNFILRNYIFYYNLWRHVVCFNEIIPIFNFHWIRGLLFSHIWKLWYALHSLSLMFLRGIWNESLIARENIIHCYLYL